MRCHSRRVNAVFVSTPVLGGVFRPIPIVVMAHVGAMWLAATICWISHEYFARVFAAEPAFLLMHRTPVTAAGYWLHGICAALLLADTHLARGDPPSLRWTRRGTWAVAWVTVGLSLWSFTAVHRHAQAALTEWHWVPEMYERAESYLEYDREERDEDDDDSHFRDEAQELYRRALAIRPGDPEAHDRLAWHLLTEPDPENRDLEQAQSHADWAERITVGERWWYRTDRARRRHFEVMAAVATLRGNRRKALEYARQANRAWWTTDGEISDRMYLEMVLEACPNERQRQRMLLILDGRPWDIDEDG